MPLANRTAMVLWERSSIDTHNATRRVLHRVRCRVRHPASTPICYLAPIPVCYPDAYPRRATHSLDRTGTCAAADGWASQGVPPLESCLCSPVFPFAASTSLSPRALRSTPARALLPAQFMALSVIRAAYTLAVAAAAAVVLLGMDERDQASAPGDPAHL